jgi:hypothetical protein
LANTSALFAETSWLTLARFRGTRYLERASVAAAPALVRSAFRNTAIDGGLQRGDEWPDACGGPAVECDGGRHRARILDEHHMVGAEETLGAMLPDARRILRDEFGSDTPRFPSSLLQRCSRC